MGAIDPELALELSEARCQAVRAELAAIRAENARYREALLPFSLHAAALMAKHYAAMTEISSVGHSHLVAGACFDARAALSGAPHEAKGARAGIFLTLEQAREIEWAGWDDTLHVECCPACMTTANLGDDHAPDCWLARAIKQAEEAGQDEAETIEDGFGNAWSAKCPACGGRIEVVRPGKVQCENCG